MTTATARPKKGDETFTWITLGFNIRRALEIIGDRAPGYTYKPDQLDTGRNMVVINEEYALSAAVDPTKPVIMATLPGRWGLLLIDGHHRLFKAVHQRRPQIAAHILSEAESRACCFTPGPWTKLAKEPR